MESGSWTTRSSNNSFLKNNSRVLCVCCLPEGIIPTPLPTLISCSRSYSATWFNPPWAPWSCPLLPVQVPGLLRTGGLWVRSGLWATNAAQGPGWGALEVRMGHVAHLGIRQWTFSVTQNHILWLYRYFVGAPDMSGYPFTVNIIHLFLKNKSFYIALLLTLCQPEKEENNCHKAWTNNSTA